MNNISKIQALKIYRDLLDSYVQVLEGKEDLTGLGMERIVKQNIPRFLEYLEYYPSQSELTKACEYCFGFGKISNGPTTYDCNKCNGTGIK